MEKPNLPQDPNEEVDILRLFEYFKKGVKQIFAAIAGISVGIFSAFLDLILLVLKNWPLVLGLSIAFAFLGYMVNKSLPPKYSYEMIVKPNYDSSLELYNRISNLNIDLEIFRSKQIVEVVSNLKQVENDSFRTYINLVTGALIGFLLSVLLLRLFKKYLNKYEQKKLQN